MTNVNPERKFVTIFHGRQFYNIYYIHPILLFINEWLYFVFSLLSMII